MAQMNTEQIPAHPYVPQTEYSQTQAMRRAGRALVAASILAVSACTGSASGEHIEVSGCVTVDSSAEEVPYSTILIGSANAHNLALEGLIADTTVVTGNVTDVEYHVEAPRSLNSNFRAIQKSSDTLSLGFTCPNTSVTIPRKPSITVTIPKRANVDIQSTTIGNTTVGDITGKARINLTGTGFVKFGNVGEVHIGNSGTGDASFKQVNGSFFATGEGVGNINAASVRGKQLFMKASGTGGIHIDGGIVNTMTAETSATGDIFFGGTAEQGTLIATGTGDLTISHVKTILRKSEEGTGDISVN